MDKEKQKRWLALLVLVLVLSIIGKGLTLLFEDNFFSNLMASLVVAFVFYFYVELILKYEMQKPPEKPL